MAKMGKYCKAYPVARLRTYPQWSENAVNTQMQKIIVDGKEVQAPRELSNDDYLYLQENFVVTDGIFIDQHIIFDKVDDEWKDFCRGELRFDENGHLAVKEREAAAQDEISNTKRE